MLLFVGAGYLLSCILCRHGIVVLSLDLRPSDHRGDGLCLAVIAIKDSLMNVAIW